MVDTRLETDATRDPHWPDEDGEPALPTTDDGAVPAMVGGTTATGTIPVAGGIVRPDSEATTKTSDEGTDTGDPDEWRVPRD